MTTRIVNLTQHPATPEQMDAGVFDLDTKHRNDLLILLSFSEIPDEATLRGRAACIVALTLDSRRMRIASVAMIGGAPYLMPTLEKEMIDRGIKPVYAFSKRESVEEMQPSGGVKKTSVFSHLGFVAGGATTRCADVGECQEAQNIVDSEPMVFCPICGGRTRYIGSKSNNCNMASVWHDYENRECRNCDIRFYVDDARELCQGTIEPRFGTPKENPAIERFFGRETTEQSA